MTIRVALNHRTCYRYDRLISVGPQVIRLRPAAHSKTAVSSYSIRVAPEKHFINWQQDPHGNFLARYVFPEKISSLEIEVDLIADMAVINPFDFFVEEGSTEFPLCYEASLAYELRPYLESSDHGPRFEEFLADIDRTPRNIVDFLVSLNHQVQSKIRYLIRLEPGIQAPEETLEKESGSCRDSAWLLVQVLRRLGLASRFVSGYLIQLAPDVRALDGPSGPETDFTDLHAWTEVFLPGAGWIGLDPTSGLLAGEGHIPLACTPSPSSAAPITGTLEVCETQFEYSMSIKRIAEDPRVTKPYSEEQWKAVCSLGERIDERLEDDDVRLTMGGEPTFVSIDDMEGAEWNSAAVGPAKRRLSEELIKRLLHRFAPGGLLHYGQGKWYPGESLPRWSLACYWRRDGVPLWKNSNLIADIDRAGQQTLASAESFADRLAAHLQIDAECVQPAFEDPAIFLLKENTLPINVDPIDSKLEDAEERARLAAVFDRGLQNPIGFVIPLQRQWWQGRAIWVSGKWPTRRKRILVIPGDSPMGLRLPLDSLPYQPASYSTTFYPMDPTGPLPHLPPRPPDQRSISISEDDRRNVEISPQYLSTTVIRTALCVEPRHGRLHVFMPPVQSIEDYIDLVYSIEQTAEDLQMPVVIEGYPIPVDPRIQVLKVTPDPGVIEVNTHPTRTWNELREQITGLYEEARLTRLGTEKFDLDGKHTGTGGGNHIVVGGATPLDSPFLRRPDLLRSLIGYWVNHPSLSYLFSGRFIGPTSQAPRIDEGRRDAIEEMSIAFAQVPEPGRDCPPWLVDRIFRNLLVDLTGNTHRAEICIDKLYSPDSSSGRLGLVELRGFEMPPHSQMSLVQHLLIRALISRFWRNPYRAPLVEWGQQLHARFLLPHFVWQDFLGVIEDLRLHGLDLSPDWFLPHFEFRFPKIGEVCHSGIAIELRQAIEPWYVLGEEPGAGGTVRYVDSSVERLQIHVRNWTPGRYVITCNRRRVPLHPTGDADGFVGAVRYRAWQPPHCLHPTIPVHTPLVFDILDSWSSRSVGGCIYHVAHPAGRNYETFPVNAYEAEARRWARFASMGYTPGPMTVPAEECGANRLWTLDLRHHDGRAAVITNPSSIHG